MSDMTNTDPMLIGPHHPDCAEDEICPVCASETAWRIFGKKSADLVKKWEAMFRAWQEGRATSPSSGDLAEEFCRFYGQEFDVHAQNVADDIETARENGLSLLESVRYAMAHLLARDWTAPITPPRF
jgi:hypothetical protein